MKYIIMLLIIVGLVIADVATGFIKAYCTDSVKSSKMRKGGLNKIGEIIVMSVVCGLDIGIKLLGHYYQSAELAGIAGAVTATAVFVYIVAMELVSILENFAAINPEAAWVARIIKRLKNINGDRKDNE